MKASETTLLPILEGTKQYVIPLFQRPYSWRRRQWQELWRDLLALYDASDGREHFLGAIVTMPVDMSPEGINKYLLIDGQQRITTLFIILATIRDLTADTDPKTSAQINELYLQNKWEDGTNRYKLLPTQVDREAFFNIIEGKDTGDGAIQDVYTYYRRHLDRLGVREASVDLSKLAKILVQQLALVSIVLHREENPYNIFESLNAKGQPLTQADLVRNYFLMRVENERDQTVAYQDYWRPMERSLGKALTDFMWRYINKDGAFVRQNLIYDEFKKRLALKSPSEVVDVLLDMHTYSEYYHKLIDPAQEPDPEISRRLSRINRWEIKTAYPFLLCLYSDYEHHRLSRDDMTKALSMIESFVVRRFFCGVTTNILNRLFISLYRTLDTDNLVSSMQEQLLARRWPSDEEFLAGWRKAPIYRSGTAKCRHVLESLEWALTRNNEPVDLSYPKVTIEHVMPQTLNEMWEQALGREGALTHATLLHTVGNLTLTGQNQPMGNSPFTSKKRVFAESNFALNRYFHHVVKWDADAISQRAEDLWRVAVTIWPRPELDADRIARDDPTGYKPTGFSLFGQHHAVGTWRELLIKVCALLAEKHGVEGFAARATQVTGTTRQYVSTSPEGMISPAEIPGTELWVETNQSSRSVLWVVTLLLQALGYTKSEFEAYW